MRNLTLLADRQYGLVDETASAQVVSFASSTSLDGGSIYVLLDTGVLYAFQIQDVTLDFIQRWDLPASVPPEDVPPPSSSSTSNDWFDVSYVGMTGCIVCMSHAGLIMSIEDQEPDKIELVGVIDGGIATARWSGDQNSLVIVTNNNSLMCMSSAWELLYEVPTTENRLPSSLSSLSWRGNSDAFALVATDAADSTTCIRLYNREMELTSVGRNIAEGAGSVMKGVGSVCSYAPNGSYVALAQMKGKKQQVAFLERNGYRYCFCCFVALVLFNVVAWLLFEMI
jgi:hypothetical protein